MRYVSKLGYVGTIKPMTQQHNGCVEDVSGRILQVVGPDLYLVGSYNDWGGTTIGWQQRKEPHRWPGIYIGQVMQ